VGAHGLRPWRRPHVGTLAAARRPSCSGLLLPVVAPDLALALAVPEVDMITNASMCMNTNGTIVTVKTRGYPSNPSLDRHGARLAASTAYPYQRQPSHHIPCNNLVRAAPGSDWARSLDVSGITGGRRRRAMMNVIAIATVARCPRRETQSWSGTTFLRRRSSSTISSMTT
jgi:hypothetical protein